MKNLPKKYLNLFMKKAAFLFILLSTITSVSFAQMLYPVKWKFSLEQKNTEEATFKYKANFQEEWNIYSHFPPDGGPLGLYCTFEPTSKYELVGKVTEPK